MHFCKSFQERLFEGEFVKNLFRDHQVTWWTKIGHNRWTVSFMDQIIVSIMVR